MKKIMLAAAISLALGACNKGDDPDIKINTFSAKIDNRVMNAEETVWSLLNQKLQLQGTNGSKVITINVPQYNGPGTYTIAASGNEASCKVDNTIYPANNGTLVILTDNSRYLKGKFNFNAENAGKHVKIEDGSFSFTK